MLMQKNYFRKSCIGNRAEDCFLNSFVWKIAKVTISKYKLAIYRKNVICANLCYFVCIFIYIQLLVEKCFVVLKCCIDVACLCYSFSQSNRFSNFFYLT